MRIGEPITVCRHNCGSCMRSHTTCPFNHEPAAAAGADIDTELQDYKGDDDYVYVSE